MRIVDHPLQIIPPYFQDGFAFLLTGMQTIQKTVRNMPALSEIKFVRGLQF